MNGRKGFSLVEMLVVIGIIVALMAATLTVYRTVVARAQTARAEELVHETATALVQTLQSEDAWPRPILAEGGSGNGEVDEKVGGALAKRGMMSLTFREEERDGARVCVLSGLDKFGVIDPWGAEVIKRRFKTSSLSLDTPVPLGGTIRDHRLRFAVDSDYDGIVKVIGAGVKANVRASAVVWCAGRDGKFGTRDDVRSWGKGQEVK